MKIVPSAIAIAVSLTLLLSGGSTAQATERHFAFTYETTTLPKGAWELEEQFIWERGTGFDTFAFRQEVEYGITDRLQLSIYFADFEHAQSVVDGRSTAWTGSGVEFIYQLTDANKDWIGSALYLEATMNDVNLELEPKLLLQKNFGPLIVSYNGVVEAHWEDHYKDRVGVLEQTLGLSYQVRPTIAVGFEAKQEIEYENWTHSGGNAVFVGPNVSFHKDQFFGAATCLFRVSDVTGEPHIELGCVLGVHF